MQPFVPQLHSASSWQMYKEGALHVYADHKSVIYALRVRSDLYSPQQHHYLSFISEFTTDICHFSGVDNVTVETLSCGLNTMELACSTVDYIELVAAQRAESDGNDVCERRLLWLGLRCRSSLLTPQFCITVSSASINQLYLLYSRDV